MDTEHSDKQDERQDQVKASLLTLPPELHALIASHLDLASRYILRLVCRTLAPEAGHESLMIPLRRFSLAETKQAAARVRQLLNPTINLLSELSKEFRSHQRTPSKTSNQVFWENASQTFEPPPRISRVSIADDADLRSISKDTDPDYDARLFTRALDSLVGVETSQTRTGVKLSSLSLISWFGISGDRVLRMLADDTRLRSVKLLVKTERHDEVFRRPVIGYDEEANLLYPKKTQATLRVGSRLREPSVKGAGLIIGYECICFQSHLSSTLSKEGERGAVIDRDDPLLDQLHPEFHLILQGRYNVGDALQLEEQLATSHITCNSCKSALLF